MPRRDLYARLPANEAIAAFWGLVFTAVLFSVSASLCFVVDCPVQGLASAALSLFVLHAARVCSRSWHARRAPYRS